MVAVARAKGRPVARPRMVGAAAAGVIDQAAARALDQQREAIAALERRAAPGQVLEADLAAGTVVLAHRLGRVPAFVTVAPSVADATFAWAVAARTKTTVSIACVGAAQPGALVEVR